MTSHPVRLPGDLWPILATPFHDDLSLDLESLARQVEFCASIGASGVVGLGVFGEAGSLSAAEQEQVAATVARSAAGMPFVLGVAGRSAAVAAEQGKRAVEAARAAGAEPAAVMVMVTTAQVPALVTHLRAVHDATGCPVVVQDYPLSSGVSLPAAQLIEVIEQCPFVAAVKAEAAPSPVSIAQLAPHLPVPVFGGLGGVGLVDELACGAAGAMTGFSCPEALREVLDAWAEGGFEGAVAAWGPWLPLATFEAQQGISLAVRKALLAERGVLATAAVRPPARALPAELAGLVTAHLDAAGMSAALTGTS